MTKERTKFSESSDIVETRIRELVIHNDDFNTFDFVIRTLIEVCNHEPEQAEQCTLIIHHKGKCPVLSGDYYTLEPIYREILNRGITATID
jgi:ATP-dependent Clp protease adaptor protein ClpS